MHVELIIDEPYISNGTVLMTKNLWQAEFVSITDIK